MAAANAAVVVVAVAETAVAFGERFAYLILSAASPLLSLNLLPSAAV